MDLELSRTDEPLHFKNPPIVEAVIGIDVSPLPESIVAQLRARSNQMAELGYKAPMPVSQTQFEVKIDAGGSAASTHDFLHGLKFDSQDGLHAVQFNRAGFIFSRLGRYEKWESFRDEARKLWEVYSSVVGPAELKDYGVRYINKVYIPFNDDLSIYLTIYPQIPTNIPQLIQECFMRLSLPIEKPQGKLTHQQILLAPEKPGYATVILDNDFRFSALGLTVDGLWKQLEDIRKIKDEYFVKFITNKLMETFNA